MPKFPRTTVFGVTDHGRADPRREVVLGFELRVVVPAQSEIDASALSRSRQSSCAKNAV